VPLTSSLYVPGKLTDVENVVVDVGTGYYVKKVGLLDFLFHLPSAVHPCVNCQLSLLPSSSPPL
jgi:hypothetical protein